jgi:hypothetical protein
MLPILLKTFTFLFPFIKEMFLGKDNQSNKDTPTYAGKIGNARGVKKLLIGVGCLSVILNIYLIKQIFIIGKENLSLHKKINETKETTPKPTVPKPKVDVVVKPNVEEKETVVKPHVVKKLKSKPKVDKSLDAIPEKAHIPVDQSDEATIARKRHRDLIEKLNNLENYK